MISSATISGSGNTVSLNSGDTVTVSNTPVLIGSNATNTIIGNNDTIFAGSNDTINVTGQNNSVSATSSTINLGSNSTLTLSGGSDTISMNGSGSVVNNGGNGIQTYSFGWTGTNTVNNGANGTIKGQVHFTVGSANQLWFMQSGSDLVIKQLGMGNQLIIAGWYANAGNQVSAFGSADGFQLSNSAVAALVNAMATYQTNNPGFNPATATQLPNNAALLSAVAAAWPGSLSTSNVTVAYAQANQTVLDAHAGGYTVADTAANVTAGLAFLASDASHISSITLTDGGTPTLPLTATQYAADTAGLAKITSAYNLSISGVAATNSSTVAGATHVTSIAVSDTGANVVANIAALQTLAMGTKLASIALTDVSMPTLPLTAAQYSADSTALGKISSAYNLSISGVTAANASPVAGAAHVISITVSDTSTNFITNIAALQTLATGTKLASITLTDSGTPTLPLTAVQYSADGAALGKITSAYNLTVSGVTAANASTVAGNSHVTSLTVFDTGANVATNIAAIQTIVAKVSSITLTDGTTPTLPLTAAQYAADTAALAKITSAYNLSISGVTAANASTVAGAAHVTSITVSDTAQNVKNNIAALQTLATNGKLASITLTDGTTPTITLTEAQMVADAAALSKISSAYNLTLTGGGTTTMPTGVAPRTVTLQSSSTPYTITANATSGLTITDYGVNGHDTINANAGDTVNVGGNGINGYWDIVNISSGTANVTGDANVLIAGNNNTVSIGASGSAGIQGTGDVVTCSYTEIWLVDSATTLTVIGTGTEVDSGNSGNRLTIGGNGAGGDADLVVMSSAVITIQTNSRVDTWGNSNTINASTNDVVGVYGANNTITLGSGDSVWFGDDSNSANNVVNAATGGNEQYYFYQTFGHDTINNGGGTTANGTVHFTGSITDENLWFKRSGNDLLITRLNSGDQINIAGWYNGTAGNQVASFVDANGLILDNQIAQLVQAMATYQSAHSSFNPVTASSMPTDTTLQNAIGAAWHH